MIGGAILLAVPALSTARVLQLWLVSNRLPAGESSVEQGSERPTDLSGVNMSDFLRRMWEENQGQDIAEYAVMLAVILVIVVGTLRLIGSNANNAFSAAASSIQ
jgi:Flp pilus assembly pilin Flp